MTKDIKMWTDFVETYIAALDRRRQHTELRKVTKLIILLARWTFCTFCKWAAMDGQLMADFKLITQFRLNPFLEWTVICTVGAIVRNGRA